MEAYDTGSSDDSGPYWNRFKCVPYYQPIDWSLHLHCTFVYCTYKKPMLHLLKKKNVPFHLILRANRPKAPRNCNPSLNAGQKILALPKWAPKKIAALPQKSQPSPPIVNDRSVTSFHFVTHLRLTAHKKGAKSIFDRGRDFSDFVWFLQTFTLNMFHTERSWHADWFSMGFVSDWKDLPSDARAVSLTSFELFDCLIFSKVPPWSECDGFLQCFVTLGPQPRMSNELDGFCLCPLQLQIQVPDNKVLFTPKTCAVQDFAVRCSEQQVFLRLAISFRLVSKFFMT